MFAHGVSDSLTDDDLHEMAKRIIASSDSGRAKSRLSMTNPGFLILQANRDACMRIAAAALLEACRDERPEADCAQIDSMSFEELAEFSQSEEQTLLDYDQIQKRKGDHSIRIIQKVAFDVNSNVIKTPHQKDFGDYVTIVGCSTVALLIVFLVVSGVLFWT